MSYLVVIHGIWMIEQAADDEINPDVLGYIFEKYINQKLLNITPVQRLPSIYVSTSSILWY
ncbi:MAG: hypothetical protein R2865_16560 [Deinococcales bacterium]